MSVGVMKDYKLKLRKLPWSGNAEWKSQCGFLFEFIMNQSESQR